MKTFTAHLSGRSTPVLVREGYSWGATLFGPLWFLAHRAWIPAILSLCVSAAPALLPDPTQTILGLAIAWAHGLFGHDLVRWSLARRGYTEAHILAARDDDAAFARLMAARPDLLNEITT